MVELGVGMIAICLPILRPLFASLSLKSIILSIRSAISLRPFHSGGSKGSMGNTERTRLWRGMKGTHTKVHWTIFFSDLLVEGLKSVIILLCGSVIKYVLSKRDWHPWWRSETAPLT